LHSSVRNPCCLDQTSGVATSDSAAAADVVAVAVLVAADHTATLHATATMAMAEAEEAATSDSKGSHHRMGSGDAAGQGPCSLTVSFDALELKASVAAWLRLETPLGFAGWGSRNKTAASSGSWGGP
jgi:hypothetical protein